MGWVDNATPEVEARSEYRTIIAICVALSAFSILIVGARLWIRHENHGLAADDWMAILSVVFAIIYSVLCIIRMFSRPFPAVLTAGLGKFLLTAGTPRRRDEIWPGTASAGPAQGESHPLHAH